MHNSWGNRFISYLSVLLLQWNHVYIHAHVIYRLISPDMHQTKAVVNNHFWQLDLFFCLIYERTGPSWEQKLIWSAPNVIISTFFYIPKLLHVFSLPLWMDDNTLLICSVLVLWFWNNTHPLNVWWLSAHIYGICWVHGLLVGFLDVTGPVCRCHK